MSHRILPRSFFGIRFRAPVRAVRPFAQEARGHTPAGSTSTSSSSGSKSFDDAKLDKGFKERVKAMNPSGTDENQQSGAHGAGDGFGKGSGSPAAKFAPQSNLHETAGSSTSTASSSSAAAGAFKQGGNASGSLGASGSYGLGLGDQNLPKGSVMGAGEWGSQAQAGNKNTKQGLGATERDASLGFKVAGSEQSSHQASGLGRSPSAGSTQGLGQGGIGGSSSTTSGSGADRSWYENKMKRDRGDHTAPSFSPASSSSSSSSSSSADFNSVNKTASSGPSNTNLPHGLGYNQSASELGGAYGTKSSTSASSGMNRNPSATDANSSWSSQQSGAKSSQSAYQSAPMSQSSGFGYGNHASGSAAQSSTASTSTATSTSDMAADAKNLAEKLREKGHELKDKIKDKIGKVMKSDDDAPRSGRGQ